MVSTCAFKNLPTQLCDGNKTEDANSIWTLSNEYKDDKDEPLEDLTADSNLNW